MGFVKYVGILTEYQGESLSKTLAKEDGSEWGATIGGVYSLTDEDGSEITSGNLVKSGDNLYLSFTIGKTETASLEGKYLLLVSLTDTNDSEFNDVIAEYQITYQNRKAL